MKNLIHNIPAKRLEILDTRYYSNDGVTFWPGATTILDVFPKDWMRRWVESVGGFENADKIRDDAADTGSAIHHGTEVIDEGNELSWANSEGKPNYSLEEWQGLLNYVDFRNKIQPEIIAMEQKICVDELRFGGTLDRIMRFWSRNWLIDFKNANNVSPTWEFQVGAYAKAWNWYVDNGIIPKEYRVDIAAVLWLKSPTRSEKLNEKKLEAQGRFQDCSKNWQLLVHEDIEASYQKFKRVQGLWELANPVWKPLNRIYPDKIKL